jgi:hypothetical protein
MSFFRPDLPVPPPSPAAARTHLSQYRQEKGDPTTPGVVFIKDHPPLWPPTLGSGGWLVQSGDLGLADVRAPDRSYTLAVLGHRLAGRVDLDADSLFLWAYELAGPAGCATPTVSRLQAFVAVGSSWCPLIDPAAAAALHRLTLAHRPGGLAPLEVA